MSWQEDITQPADSTDQLAKELNLGSLLEPASVPFTFETIGWPILAMLIALSILIAAFWQIRKYRHNRYRREALAELHQISAHQKNLCQIFVVLKRTAIVAFTRETVGNLSGKAWLQFLEESGQNIEMLVFEKEIENLIYKDISPEKDVREKLLSNSEKWIRTHAT